MIRDDVRIFKNRNENIHDYDRDKVPEDFHREKLAMITNLNDNIDNIMKFCAANVLASAQTVR